jgi:diguanylate cyclase (GGDEF)-like protein
MAKQCILVCRNYLREVDGLQLPETAGEVEFSFFADRCGLPPEAFEEVKSGVLSDYDAYHVISGGCIKGIPEGFSICKPAERSLHHCIDLLISPELAEYYARQGFYMVTPGWLANWAENLKKWGFDRETSLRFFNDAANTILLIDTGTDDEAAANLEAFSKYIGLPWNSISVGLEYLNLLVNNKLLKSSLELTAENSRSCAQDNRRELADFTMALDLLNSLVQVHNEDEVLEGIKNIFTMLFAPREVVFRAVGQVAGDMHIKGEDSFEDSFSLPVLGSEGLLGHLDLVGLELPQHKEQYKKLAARIVNICGLALENARHYRMIQDLSNTDGLTGIANRRLLEEHLKQEWRRMKRDQSSLALVMADIDNFKKYNDLYGHQAGDDCLKAVARVLDQHCRRPGDLAARYGGEEFMLVLPATDLDGATDIVDRISLALKELEIKHEASDSSQFVTASFGIAGAIPDTSFKVEDLVAAADKALYDAKSNGRNCSVVSEFGQIK